MSFGVFKCKRVHILTKVLHWTFEYTKIQLLCTFRDIFTAFKIRSDISLLTHWRVLTLNISYEECGRVVDQRYANEMEATRRFWDKAGQRNPKKIKATRRRRRIEARTRIRRKRRERKCLDWTCQRTSF